MLKLDYNYQMYGKQIFLYFFITRGHMLDARCVPLGDFIFKPSSLYLPGAVPFFLLYLLRNYSLLTEARYPKGNIQNTKNCTKRSKTLDSEITNKRKLFCGNLKKGNIKLVCLWVSEIYQ